VADHEALHKLLEWRMGLAGPDADPPDSREIRDWLWLSAQLDGVQLPWQYTNKVRSTKASEEDQPSHPETTHASTPASSPDPRPEVRAPAPPDPHLATPFPADPPAPEAAADPVARLLADNLLPDDAEVAEALQRRQGGVPLRVRQLALLPYPLQILQALRPLLRRRPHPHWRVLDEERSAAKSAEMGLAWPVFRPRRVPMVAVRLVLDGGVSMAVWEPLAQELQRVLASSQAFHRVDLQRLTPPDLPTRQLASGADDDTTVTLLLSDTAGRHWWDGSILPWLQTMANQQPLVVLHTLPLRYWESTALQRAPALTLKNCEPLAANNRYQPLLPLRDPWDDPGATDSLPPAGGTCLPVISLDRRELGPWAALVMGEAYARCAGRVLPGAEPQLLGRYEQSTSATAEINEEEAERLWQEFAQRASPEARELMLSMAASLFLTLPVLRLLLAVVAPKAFAPQPLAEVLVSGLVRRLPGQEGVGATPERLQFELMPAVQRLLEPKLDPQRRRQVLAAVTDLLERHWDRQGNGTSFRALLLGPKEVLERDHPDLFHIANVTAAMLDQLPGRQFRELAAQLRGRESVAPAPVWPASMVFSDLEYQSAQLLPISEPETISFGTAHYAEVDLHQISFETATVTGGVRQLDVNISRSSTWAFFERLASEGDKWWPNPAIAGGAPALEGHSAAVTALAVLPDARLASGADDRTIKLWDPASGQLQATLEGHSGPVRALAVFPGGRLASGAVDATIKLWDSDSGQLQATLQGHTGSVNALAVLPDGRLASGADDDTIKLWDPASGQLQATLEGHSDSVNALAVLPDGRLASGASDGTIKLWDPASGQLQATLEGHSGSVNALAVLGDGHLASGSGDKTIRLWDPASGTCERVFEGHQGEVSALAVMGDGHLASGSDDNTIRLWDPATGTSERVFKGRQDWVRALAVLGDGRLASGSRDYTIRLWDPAGGESPSGPNSQLHELNEASVGLDGEIKSTAESLILTLVEIPAGSFLMGSPPEEPERSDNEGPQHEVKLESFFMSQTPITQAQWRAVAQWQERPGERWGRELDPEPSFFEPRRNPKARSFDDARFSLLEGETDSEQRPVENVSWLDAVEFCSRLSQRTGRTYALPSEAQWEYACRAGTTTPFHFGATLTPELANYDGNYLYAEGPKGEYRKQTTPVGIFPANAWGLHEMHGNVLEWCLDPWHVSYKGAPADGTAWLNTAESNNKQTIEKGNKSDSEQQQKLLRGGSWGLIPGGCRSAYRYRTLPDDAIINVGFRVVCLPQGPSLNS
jgi:formylglycine-generating enzyme required for sulfatase activity